MYNGVLVLYIVCILKILLDLIFFFDHSFIYVVTNYKILCELVSKKFLNYTYFSIDL